MTGELHIEEVLVDHRDLAVRVGDLEGRVQSLESQFLQFRVEMRDEFSALRQEMRELHERTLSQMRVLHEDVIERIKWLGEGLNRGSA